MLCLWAAPAFAKVPDATIQRIVELNVQTEENRFLRNNQQIDIHTFYLRSTAIDPELKTLYRQLAQFPADEQQQAKSQIEGLTKLRLATLVPQLQARAAQFRQQQVEHDRTVNDALTADVRAALEPQRRRLLLQQRRDRGEITAEQFATEDKKAMDEIMALRGKYASEGQGYVDSFDHQLEQMSQAIATNPAMPIPVSRVPAGQGKGQGGTSPADYQRDVSLAVELLAQITEVSNRYSIKKDIDAPTWRETDMILTTDLGRLRQKWQAAGKGSEFERDYRQGGVAVAAARRQPAPAANTGQFSQPSAGTVVSATDVIVFSAIVALPLFYWFSRRRGPPARETSTVYGTAHYAAMETDIKDDACLANGLFFGKSSQPGWAAATLGAQGAPVCSTAEHHTLIVARTRTGKGTRVIIPTLLRYRGSALVIDPKGENAAITAGIRKEQLKQSIHILNPWKELAATYEKRGFIQATYNPLDILVRTDPSVVAIAQTLAGAICPAPPNAKDRFWQGSAANVLTAVFLWLADQPGEQKTLGRAREIVSLTRKDFTAKYLIPMAASEAFSGAIREMAAPFIDLADETYSGVMSNLSESTKFLSDPQIKAATAKSSFAMEDLATQKATVYVVIPTERMDTQKTWLRLVIAAAMHIFKNRQTKLPYGHRCLFLIDEFAALGRLDDLPRDIATMSGFGVDFALIVQGLDQLKDHYAEAKATILSNCAYQWFCNVNDLESAKYLSDTLGKATVETTSTSSSSSSSSSAHGGSSSSSQSTTHSETGRSLLNPDEVLNLGKDVAIAIQPNGHPHYLRPVDYWNLTKAFVALQQTHPALYWQPPIAYDENPYFAPPPPPPPPPGGGNGGSGAKEKARPKPPPPKPEPFMTEERARDILEVERNASRTEILAAYRRLIQKVHPDLGGSSYFSKELNAAKALLLGE